jgi:cell division protein FtsW
VFLAQFFVAGLNVVLVGLTGALVAAGGVGAYFVLPHVRSRVDRFLDPSSGDTFQITKAMEAFGNGGLFGRGPGEGRVKNALPDAHADFVFAVAGEEFGFVVCLLILSLFAFVVVRGLAAAGGRERHVRGAGRDRPPGAVRPAGLRQHGLLPAPDPDQGHDLPFVSYGGSSVLAIALGMGMLLALTRRRGPRLERGRHEGPGRPLHRHRRRRHRRPPLPGRGAGRRAAARAASGIALMTDARSAAFESPAFASANASC